MFYSVICLCAMVLLIIYPGISHKGAEVGLTLFLDALLPFMLPYLVLCNWLMALCLKNPMQLRSIIYVSFILSVLGGYPIGAILISKLITQGHISNKQASYFLPILHHPSPVFLFGYVASTITNSIQFCLVFLLINSTISFICLLIALHFFKISSDVIQPIHQNPFPFSQSMKETLAALSLVAINVVFFCTIFYVAIHVLHSFSIQAASIDVIIANLLEITNGLKLASAHFSSIHLQLFTAFMLSLQSISIHMQIWVIAKAQNISFKPYILIRLVFTSICTTIFFIITATI